MEKIRIHGSFYTVDEKNDNIVILTRLFDGSKWYYEGSFLNRFSPLKRIPDVTSPKETDVPTQQYRSLTGKNWL